MKANKYYVLAMLAIIWSLGCKTSDPLSISTNLRLPSNYHPNTDTTNTGKINWKLFFSDSNLVALIDTALEHNQELNITLQEIEISKNEIKARKGEYLPFVGLGINADADKEGKFTRHGALDENLDIEPNLRVPNPYTNIGLGLYASWELDIWKKLRNSKKVASLQYLSNIEGKNFMLCNLVSEIALSYYELLSLDYKLAIVDQNIQIQSNALESVRYKKQASQVTELAVKKFEAQLLNSKSLRNTIVQEITSTENKLNFLTARYPSEIKRSKLDFVQQKTSAISIGTPEQLLINRPDVKQAELKLIAAGVNIKIAKANFYPSLTLFAGAGIEAYKIKLLSNPESIMYNVASELLAPILNRNAIKATYKNAKAQQIQAIYEYQQSVLKAYLEILSQEVKYANYKSSVELKEKEVELLNKSVQIANDLFNSARADYMEVLLTQRDAIESRMDLAEYKLHELSASIALYKSLGGGWR